MFFIEFNEISYYQVKRKVLNLYLNHNLNLSASALALLPKFIYVLSE